MEIQKCKMKNANYKMTQGAGVYPSCLLTRLGRTVRIVNVFILPFAVCLLYFAFLLDQLVN
jgi:hypothetical protein